jgi:hypothetical protein
MNEQTARALWNELQQEMYSAERTRAIAAGPVDDAHLRSLAERVVKAIDELPAPSKPMLIRREYAQAFADFYAPIPAPKAEPAREYALLSFWHS